VAVVTWITLLAAAGFRSTPSTLIVPLEHEFGWSRATISIAVSINLVLFGLFAPFAGGLMERFGVRRAVVGAFPFGWIRLAGPRGPSHCRSRIG
jgi:cyanate permease